MTHADLFSGIGGFSLAAHAMNWETAFHCEIDPFCQRVLRYHFPQSKLYEDIFATDFTIYRGRIDVFTGGFPCQPFSVAGLQNGTEDPRFLWPQMYRAIREIQPRWVVAENVSGLISNKSGVVFEQVCADLENEGYQVQAVILPALGVDSSHLRYRVYIVAHTDGNRKSTESVHAETCRIMGTQNPDCVRRESNVRKKESGIGKLRLFGAGTSDWVSGNSTHPISRGRVQGNQESKPEESHHSLPDWRNFPTQSAILVGNDGLPNRLDGITLSRWRRQTIKAAGNAVIPALVYQIFKVIDLMEKMKY